MDDEMIFERLDSVWFFSSILSPSSSSSSSHPPPFFSSILSPSSSSSSSHPPLIQPSNTKLGQDPTSTTLVGPIQASPKSKSFETTEVTEQRKKKRSGEQSKKRSCKLRREEIEEAKELVGLISTPVKCKDYNYQNGCRVQQVSCDLAMKQQLRSWAHAVACTVK